MKRKLSALCLSGLLLAVWPTTWAGAPQPLIDCDAGGDLAVDLPRAVAAGYTTIYLRGTCIGNLEIDTSGLQLRGEPRATIQGVDSGGFPAAIRVVGPIELVLRDLEIRDGYFGVRVENSGAFVQLIYCDVHANSVGLMAERGSVLTLFGSEVHDHEELGILATSGSEVRLNQSLVHDNRTGIVAYDRAILAILNQSEIRDNVQVGVEVRQLATAQIVDTLFSNNGDLHVFATDRSQVNIRFDSTLGAADDPTSSAVFVADTSEVSIGSGATVWGSVTAWSGRVRIFLATLHGRLTLERFSDGIVQSNAVVDGGIVCTTGSDALCAGAAASATDCPSSRNDCEAPGVSEPHRQNQHQNRQQEQLDQQRHDEAHPARVGDPAQGQSAHHQRAGRYHHVGEAVPELIGQHGDLLGHAGERGQR